MSESYDKKVSTQRTQAEERLGILSSDLKISENLSPEETRCLIHELQVHQIELEMQNEELHRAHEELEAGRDRYLELYDFSPVGYVTVSAKGIIQSANLTLTIMLGIERQALQGKPLSHFVAKEDKDELYLHYRQLCKTQQCGLCELRMTLNGGEEFHARLETMPVTGDDGAHTGYRITICDITARKQAEQVLAQTNIDLEHRVLERTETLHQANEALIQEAKKRSQAEQRLQLTSQVFKNTAEGIVITDRANRIVEVNAAFTKITGYTFEEAQGQDPGFLKSGRHDRAFYTRMWQAIDRDGYWQGEIWDRCKDGAVFPKWLTINTVRDNKGELTNYISIFSDISRAKDTERELEKLAFFDPLTGLPNRLLFRDRLEHVFAEVKRSERKVALLFLDLDHFKRINDTLGHPMGDALLKIIAQRIQSCLRSVDTVARMGGDEFTIILSAVEHAGKVAHIAENILAELKKPIELGDNTLFVTGSIGIAIHPGDGDTADSLVKNADTAMFHAKEIGRNRYSFFEREMDLKAQSRMELESGLRAALESDGFAVYYQPKIDIQQGRIIGAEALVRWIHPEKGMIQPDEFIPVAEEAQLIRELGAWVLKTAVRDTVEQLLPLADGALAIAVNLSTDQIDAQHLIPLVHSTLNESGLPPHALELEITESIMMGNVEEAIGILEQLREMGVRILVDDFGTGYSSLSYLKRFPIHTLKIDRSFVRDLPEDKDDAALVTATLAMAHSLGLEVIAEGVETEAQSRFLKQHHCHQHQGYLYSRPLPLHEFVDFMTTYQVPTWMEN